MAHKLTAKLSEPRVLIHRAPGRPERQVVKVECALTGDSIEVATAIIVPLKSGTEDAAAVATYVREALPKHFASNPDIFKEQEIALSVELPTAEDCKAPIVFEVNDSAHKDLKSQSAHNADVRAKFKDAVEKLNDYARMGLGGINSRRTEIERLLDYLARCLEVADVGNQATWHDTKLAEARSAFMNLFGRTQESHPNVAMAKTTIDGALYGYHAPTRWAGRPPSS